MDREQDRTKTETSARAFSFQRVIAEGLRGPARPSSSASFSSSSCLFNCKGLAATQSSGLRVQWESSQGGAGSARQSPERKRLPDSRPPCQGEALSAGPQGAGAPGQRQSLHLLAWNAFESLMKAISHPVPNDKRTGSRPKASGRFTDPLTGPISSPAALPSAPSSSSPGRGLVHPGSEQNPKV